MNGIPLLDSIPVNWFILGVSILAGVILFLILTQIPDDDEEEKKDEKSTLEPDPMTLEEVEKPKTNSKSKSKKKASKK